MNTTTYLDSKEDSRPKMPLFVKVSLCSAMVWPGVITYWLTSVANTYKIGTFYGVVCVVLFAAIGIYHRRKIDDNAGND